MRQAVHLYARRAAHSHTSGSSLPAGPEHYRNHIDIRKRQTAVTLVRLARKPSKRCESVASMLRRPRSTPTCLLPRTHRVLCDRWLQLAIHEKQRLVISEEISKQEVLAVMLNLQECVTQIVLQRGSATTQLLSL